MSLQKVRDRVKKLLALAESSNPHEAANAAQRAAELMLEWELELADVQGELEIDVQPSKVTEWTLERGINRNLWKGHLAAAAAALFGCGFYFKGADLQIVGVENRAELVESTFRYLETTVRRLAEEAWAEECKRTGMRKGSASGHFWRSSFQTAAACEISFRAEKFTRDRRKPALWGKVAGAAPSSSTALATIVDEDVDAYLDRVCPSYAGEATVGDSGAGYAGQRAGSKVDFGAPGLSGRKLKA